MQANLDVIIIPVSSDPLNLEPVKEGEKLQKIEYLENEKSFLDERKKAFFIIFEIFSFGKI